MEKKIILLPILLFFHFVSAQEVKFTDGEFGNGLIYPIAEFGANPEARKTLNKNIYDIYSAYEDQDYCIGQYGYVQQTSFIQLHFYFNCLDMDDSKNEYHLFNLIDGNPCPPSDMFLDKQRDRFRAYFQEKVADHLTRNGKVPPPKVALEALIIDDFTVKLLERGIELTSTKVDGWPDANLFMSWAQLKPYLKTTFI